MRKEVPDFCPKCNATSIPETKTTDAESPFSGPKYVQRYMPPIPVQELYKPEHLLFTCITCGFEIETRCKDATDEQWKVYEELHGVAPMKVPKKEKP